MPKEADDEVNEKVKELLELFDQSGKEDVQQGKALNKRARRAPAKKEKNLVNESACVAPLGAYVRKSL